ncbi:MAG: recombinase family protein [Blastocatellia bacterium]|nr:recombinase family protein [Blastocatellia bacterium]
MAAAWVYTRKSRALGDPDDDPYILAHQREALLRLATQQGLQVPPDHVIEEIGSGEHLTTRPRFAALLETLQKEGNSGAVLYVSGIERISRAGMALAGQIFEVLVTAGVCIQTTTQRYDLTDNNQRLFVWFSMGLGRHGLDAYREAVKARKEQLLRDGEPVTGAAPYGYCWNKNAEKLPGQPPRGRLEVDPGPFAVVRALFQEAPAMSIVTLAQRYHLSHSRVRYILRNPVYTGYPAQHCRMLRVDGKRWMQLLPPDQWKWPERPGNYPPAVSRAQFAAVQQAIDSRFSRYARGKAINGWCRDLLFLQGERVHASLTSQPWRPGHVPVYRLVAADGTVSFYPRAAIHSAAEDRLLAALSQPQLLAEAFALESEARAQAEQQPADRLDRQRHQLISARQQLVGLKLQFAADDEDRLALREAEQKLKREIEALKNEVATAVQQPLRGLAPLAALPVSPAEIGAAWNDQPEDMKRAVANALLAGIHLEIERAPGRRNATRRILRVDYAPWYARVLEG